MPSASSRGAAPSSSRAGHALPFITVALAGSAVFRGALGYFFSQDDFWGLARAHGLLPRLSGPWRYLSGQTYFDVMGRLAGLEPAHYHAFSLLAHLACALLLMVWLKARVGAPAALLGACFFAVHPALYTALYSISGIGEVLALLFGLGALLAARSTGAWRWSAAPLFAMSLLSKESTLLLPLVAAADAPREVPRAHARIDAGSARASGSTPRSARSPLLAALSVVSIAYLAAFLMLDAFGVRATLPVQAPYHLAFDTTLLRNLLTYLGWIANFLAFTVRGFMDAVDSRVFPYGVVLLTLWLAGCAWNELRRRGWMIGGLMTAAFLLPVLPLQNHTYHYYLYAPLAGVAACLAAAADVALDVLATRSTRPAGASAGSSAGRGAQGNPSRETGGHRKAGPVRVSNLGDAPRSTVAAWALAGTLAVLLTLNGAVLVHKIEVYPFIHPALRSDPTVDRAIIAKNAIQDLKDAGIAAGARLLFWSPGLVEMARAAGRDTTRESYFETNVRSALADGLAVRLFLPQVTEVEFIRSQRPLGGTDRFVIYRLDGHLRVVDEAGLPELLRSLARPAS